MTAEKKYCFAISLNILCNKEIVFVNVHFYYVRHSEKN